MDTSNLLFYAILTIAVIIILFLVLREVNCWYWKINEGINLLKEQTNESRRIRILLEHFFFYEDKAREINCENCGEYYITTELEDSHCMYCEHINSKEGENIDKKEAEQKI